MLFCGYVDTSDIWVIMGACLSLDQEELKARARSDEIDRRIQTWARDEANVVKILLLGEDTKLYFIAVLIYIYTGVCFLIMFCKWFSIHLLCMHTHLYVHTTSTKSTETVNYISPLS